ncbi:putative Outer membrane protein [Thiobacillus denitrificans ATCC 25259]|uniref:Putative Outer membrane protein n=1 Tax=Thiobacillus denitrificans (strain ATCC 25259 / T1) TaxID=292415 RepID=Q3SHN6_THIDA|nr:TolC family protein [Thiobacillus denitrificans]AAZ97850.1 putative Outer membrane protein [Thiobacillus denitrificans ATCC 25259]
MMLKTLTSTLLAAGVLLAASSAHAETVNLQQAVAMSLAADPRVKEREQVVEAARALLEEAKGNAGWRISANAFIGLAPEVEGGFYQGGAYSGTVPRTDGDNLDGVSDWTHLDFALIKPLFTFGKIEHYGEAAQGNVDVKRGELSKTQGDIVYDTKRAYFGYLTARDIRVFLEDIQSRLDRAIASVDRNLKEENGESKQSDLYALQTAKGLLSKYVHQSRAIEKVSLDGLKVLTGVGLKTELAVVDERIAPVPFPQVELADLHARALQDRPEMRQLEAGLRARRALVAAKKADRMPNVYAGVIGQFNYASNRERLDNPYLTDPFNGGGLTPVVGVKWDSVFGVTDARINQAQAELEALNHKKAFAVSGIPFEVSEAYVNAKANLDAQQELAEGATAARRWMIASLADLSAGIESAGTVADAIRNYVLVHTEYLRTVNDYNMNVAQLARLTGELR